MFWNGAARALRSPAPVGRRPVVGSVVMVQVPFREGGGESKARPVIVVGIDGDRYITRALTTRRKRVVAVLGALESSLESGLTRRSWVRSGVVEFVRTDVLKVLGDGRAAHVGGLESGITVSVSHGCSRSPVRHE